MSRAAECITGKITFSNCMGEHFVGLASKLLMQPNENSMLPRYTRPELAAIWSEQTKHEIWFEIEAHAGDAMAASGTIPRECAKAVWQAKQIPFDAARIRELENETQHEFAAFIAYVSEIVGSENARFLHFGMTSSDVLDTCFNLQLKRATDVLIKDNEQLKDALKAQALEHKYTVCIGRSHGMHAEPTTFGTKMAQAYAEANRNAARLKSARDEISVGAISGAVGTFANVAPEVEAHVCKKLGLRSETISTQVIPRDRHAMYFSTLAVVASSIERLATEFRHLQRTEVGEVSEKFSSGQIGSSAMPHKANPILSENLTGLSRIVRSCVAPALENVALWHERDMSHSSVERWTGPGATAILDFALHRMAKIVEGIAVDGAAMDRNMGKTGDAIQSQRIVLALVEKGLARETAYRIVQKCAHSAIASGGSFFDALKSESQVQQVMSQQELEACLGYDYHLSGIDAIFSRVFG